MRSLPKLAALAAALALLPVACSKQEEPAAGASAAANESRQATSPFQRNGELLSVNVDAMPRPAFIAKMAELTGVKITAEGDNNQTVTVHVTDGTLRKVLSLAIADAPYSVSMQYTNLQDSFPASVSITRYRSGAQPALAASQPLAAHSGLLPHPERPAVMAAQEPVVQEEADRPDINAMAPDEQLKYFMSQNQEDQVSIIFDMEPTASEAALMNKLMAKDDVSSEVKLEILDSLSNTDYELGESTIKMALDATDPEVATKAAETIGQMGSEKDIPALKKLEEKTTNEDVRTAVSDAVEALQP